MDSSSYSLSMVSMDLSICLFSMVFMVSMDLSICLFSMVFMVSMDPSNCSLSMVSMDSSVSLVFFLYFHSSLFVCDLSAGPKMNSGPNSSCEKR